MNVARDCVDGEISSILTLFDHLIRSHQHIRRNRQPDLFRRFEIDDEFELLRLLNWKIGGLGAFENLVDVNGGATETFSIVGRIGHGLRLKDRAGTSTPHVDYGAWIGRRNPASPASCPRQRRRGPK
jgi:hypothetical protein